MTKEEITSLAVAVAAKHGLPPSLVLAVIQVESNFNPWAWNPEPAYRYLWDVKRNAPFRALTPEESASERPPADFPCLAGDKDQEWWGQQASWGLMQTMGAVAREMGLRAPFLTALCDPSTGLDIGCAFLSRLVKRHAQPWGFAGVVRAWNTGSPQESPAGMDYQSKILAALGGTWPEG